MFGWFRFRENAQTAKVFLVRIHLTYNAKPRNFIIASYNQTRRMWCYLFSKIISFLINFSDKLESDRKENGKMEEGKMWVPIKTIGSGFGSMEWWRQAVRLELTRRDILLTCRSCKRSTFFLFAELPATFAELQYTNPPKSTVLHQDIL